MPWAYWRYRLAELWHVPPWIVDQASQGEINEAITIMGLIAKAEQDARRR